MNRSVARIAIVSALLFGGSSLAFFVVFLFHGPINLILLDISTATALWIDATLCLLFFIQHSGMVRRSFRSWLGRFVPDYLHGAIFATVSGVCLLSLLAFWQPTDPVLASAQGIFRWLLRGLFLVSILGFVWGSRALGRFDALGIKPVRAFLRGNELRDPPLTIRGPYRWVRHPLYTSFLLMMWSHPDYSADRILFNTTWTIWMFVGAALEERDLASAFGEPYRDYQRNVPMLFPWRVPRDL